MEIDLESYFLNDVNISNKYVIIDNKNKIIKSVIRNNMDHRNIDLFEPFIRATLGINEDTFEKLNSKLNENSSKNSAIKSDENDKANSGIEISTVFPNMTLNTGSRTSYTLSMESIDMGFFTGTKTEKIRYIFYKNKDLFKKLRMNKDFNV